MNNLDLIGNAGTGRISLGQGGHVRVVLNPHCSRAVDTSGSNRNLAVSSAQVIDEVISGDVRSGEHFVYELVICWNPDHVFSLLADLWLVFLVAVFPLGRICDR